MIIYSSRTVNEVPLIHFNLRDNVIEVCVLKRSPKNSFLKHRCIYCWRITIKTKTGFLTHIIQPTVLFFSHTIPLLIYSAPEFLLIHSPRLLRQRPFPKNQQESPTNTSIPKWKIEKANRLLFSKLTNTKNYPLLSSPLDFPIEIDTST